MYEKRNDNIMDADEEIKHLLENEIKKKIRNLSINDLATLYRIFYDEYRLKIEEAKLKEEQMYRYFRLGIEVAGIILPLIFYGIWMKRGFEFEKTGTFTSTTFRNLFNRCFKPTYRR